MVEPMHAEMQCKFCPATSREITFGVGPIGPLASAGVGAMWTWWGNLERMTCPVCYELGRKADIVERAFTRVEHHTERTDDA